MYSHAQNKMKTKRSLTFCVFYFYINIGWNQQKSVKPLLVILTGNSLRHHPEFLVCCLSKILSVVFFM